MLLTIWGDDDRYRDTYWSRFAEQGWYFAGDGARYDEDGALWVLGRVDDVMNVSGHRISTSEVESALVSHPDVAEAAVIGASDETTGQGIVAFVILREGSAIPLTISSRSCASTWRSRSTDCQAARSQRRARAAEDSVGKDHAAPPQGRRRGPRTRRYLDAGRPERFRSHPKSAAVVVLPQCRAWQHSLGTHLRRTTT